MAYRFIEAYWIAAVQEADALLVHGDDVLYLARWMRESGLAKLLPLLRETVYVGVSAGSMVTAPTRSTKHTITRLTRKLGG